MRFSKVLRVKGDDAMSKQTGLKDEDIYVIKRNSDTVYRLAFAQMKNKFDADDVYQEVFYRYIKKKPEFDSPEHEKAWFIRVTLNCAKTSLASFFNTRVTELDESIQMPETDTEGLSWALKKLPKKYSAVIHLYYYEDMTAKEIAKALNIGEGNVRMLLTRARRKLKAILEKER